MKRNRMESMKTITVAFVTEEDTGLVNTVLSAPIGAK